ncbi:oxysterol-binding protein-related protein 9 isoform X2 [Homalodisca vitripennis]|uniref:oxysterol-binding protein-related protein 9 isoform X2 n=1 Tax=Homalodisca vitripennis TaxID=197043 RepID=UPI001EEC233E|nr:oxysterol-binding protein-related protein 9 isoform X2 [Homalodisca vitripennis]
MSREKMMRGVRRGCVRLKGAVIGIDDEDDSTFTITVDSKTFHFQARDAEEREKWVRCLEDTILRHAYGGYKSTGSLRLDTVKPAPTIQDFDKKLAEADAYLQILIDQTKALELRMEPMSDADDKARCEAIWNHANNMLEQVKHTIVLLQIAKNTAFPVNGSYQPVTVPDLSPKAISPGSISLNLPSDIQPGIELGAECIEPRIISSMPLQCPPIMQVFGAGLTSRAAVPPVLNVPETSYSSSEEEDFYDANDNSELASPTSSPTSTRPEPLAYEAGGPSGEMPAERRESPSTPPAVLQRASSTNFLKPDGTLDYDALYEDPNESDISMESQGSVVTHLLSQVKIGMDLTKVVLPTFILERRSLLEMYADYFAHPDMFVRIADLESERDRMVQVVRWYLASYHAGRKSSVAKKPYNPVLGEVFQCYWDLPQAPATSSQPLVNDGPVPWCHRDQLTFVAEQVSHHPPISAFYAEHYNKGISCQAYVWTKSKFLGLSIGVHNIGRGTVNLLKYNEQYTCSFPNGYGRSILTVPWIELGGSVVIECEKTGYRANIEFLTKPFYGGKKHRITADVFGPQEKKPFLSITGEWNGVMEAKWSDGRTEQFINVDNLTITKKIVRPVEQQKDNESRRLWKEVTAGLRLNNVSHATNAKCEIEQRQRIEAQRRKDANVSWQTKLFQLVEGTDKWLYNNPLEKRVSVNR